MGKMDYADRDESRDRAECTGMIGCGAPMDSSANVMDTTTSADHPACPARPNEAFRRHVCNGLSVWYSRVVPWSATCESCLRSYTIGPCSISLRLSLLRINKAIPSSTPSAGPFVKALEGYEEAQGARETSSRGCLRTVIIRTYPLATGKTLRPVPPGSRGRQDGHGDPGPTCHVTRVGKGLNSVQPLTLGISMDCYTAKTSHLS